MKNAIAYVRLSPGDRKSAGRNGNADALGPEAQRQAIERWADANGYTIVSWHTDIDVSGGDEIADRVGLMAAFAALGKGDTLIAAKQDRFARDTLIAAMIERLAERQGAMVATADGVGAGNGPEALLMRRLVQAFAEYERATIRSRTKAALAIKKQRGELTGSAPLGWTAVRRGDVMVLTEDPQEQAAFARIRDLDRSGKSLRQIGAVLTAEGYKPRGKEWYARTISRVLQRSEEAAHA